MSSKRPGRIRLAVDVPVEVHSHIKYCARNRNITMTRWILRALYARLKDEKIIEEK